MFLRFIDSCYIILLDLVLDLKCFLDGELLEVSLVLMMVRWDLGGLDGGFFCELNLYSVLVNIYERFWLMIEEVYLLICVELFILGWIWD